MALLLIVPLLLLLLAGRFLFRLALRFAAAAGLAGVAGVALSLALGRGAGVAILVAVLLFAPMLLVVGRPARRRRFQPAGAPAGPASSPWEALRRAAPWAKRSLTEAERRCADFLLLAEAQGCRPDTAELQVLVEKRVPELIADGLARCRAASPAERRQVLEDTVISVTEVATAAEARRALLWQSSGDRFAARRAHLANRLRPGPLSPL